MSMHTCFMVWVASQGAKAILPYARCGQASEACSEQHIMHKMLKSAYVGLQFNSWSSEWRHLTALCTLVPGAQFCLRKLEGGHGCKLYSGRERLHPATAWRFTY
jgi:hypothetical protein